MNPSDFPGEPEDAALDAALRRPIPLPDHIRRRLHATREEIWSDAPAATPPENVIPLTIATTPGRVRQAPRPAFFPRLMAFAAAIAVLGVLLWQLLPALRPGGDTGPAMVAGVSPQGEVGSTQPEIAWDAVPGKRYNVWILPAEGDHTTVKPLFVARDQERSPVPFSALKPGKGAPEGMTELEPDTEYRVLVCYADTGHDPVRERLSGTPVKIRVVRKP